MRRMRWYYKLAAIVGGLVIGFIVISAVVGAVVGLVFGLLIKLVIAALVVGGIALAIQRARSRRQVSGRRAEREIREPGHREYSMPPPRADVDPVPEAPVRETRRVDVEDDLARLKREMGSLA
jgi:predicted lipid-binding transport protein (Tim44 family)